MSGPDLSEFVAMSAPKKLKCQVGMVLDGEKPALTVGESDQLRAALATDKGIITNAAVSAWLEKRGHEVNYQRIANHRNGKCSCGKA